ERLHRHIGERVADPACEADALAAALVRVEAQQRESRSGKRRNRHHLLEQAPFSIGRLFAGRRYHLFTQPRHALTSPSRKAERPDCGRESYSSSAAVPCEPLL